MAADLFKSLHVGYREGSGAGDHETKLAACLGDALLSLGGVCIVLLDHLVIYALLRRGGAALSKSVECNSEGRLLSGAPMYVPAGASQWNVDVIMGLRLWC